MNRSTLMLGGAALVLAALALALVVGRDPLGRDETPGRAVFALPSGAAVDRMEIRPPAGETTVIERASSGWLVSSHGNFPADTSAVSTLLRTLGGLKGGSLVSRKPDRPEFELGPAGVEVALSESGRELLRFEVGKNDPQSFTQSYARVAGKDEVYLVQGLNRNLFTRPQGFRDRALASFAPEQVASLAVAAADTGWTATRADSIWTIVSPDGTEGEANEALVNTAIRSFATFAADGFLEAGADTVDTGLGAPGITVTVTLLSGETQSVAIGGRNEKGQRYASRPDRDAVYVIGEWRLNPFRRRAAELTAAP